MYLNKVFFIKNMLKNIRHLKLRIKVHPFASILAFMTSIKSKYYVQSALISKNIHIN